MKNIISILEQELIAEGFRVSTEDTSTPSGTKAFTVTGLKLPKVAPFDDAHIWINQGRGNLHFALTFTYSKEFESCRSKAECREIYEQDYPKWEEKIEQVLGELISYYRLTWAVDAAEPDSDDQLFELITYLEGDFDNRSYVRVRTLMLELRDLCRRNQQR